MHASALAIVSTLGARLRARAPRRIAAGQQTPAAVLVPLLARAPATGPGHAEPELWLQLIERAHDSGPHSGQIAFPGGKAEPGEAPLDTAWREAREEVGLRREHCQYLGQLDDTQTLTGFTVSAFVALVAPEHPALRPDPSEVAGLLSVPWALVADRTAWRPMTWTYEGARFSLPSLPWQGQLIWGLTARLLLQLVSLVDGSPPPESAPLARLTG